jgi:hypothetical protein
VVSDSPAEARWWECERASLLSTLAESEAALQAMEAQLGAALALARSATEQGEEMEQAAVLAVQHVARTAGPPSVSLAQLPPAQVEAERQGLNIKGGGDRPSFIATTARSVGSSAEGRGLEDRDDETFSFGSISTAEIEAHAAPPSAVTAAHLSARLGEVEDMAAAVEEALRKRGLIDPRPPPASRTAWRSALHRVAEAEPARDASPSQWVAAAWTRSVEALTAALAPPVPSSVKGAALAEAVSINFRVEAQRDEARLDALQKEGIITARQLERRQRAVRDLVTGMAEARAAAAAGAGAARRAVQLQLDEATLECDRLRRQAREREAARAANGSRA